MSFGENVAAVRKKKGFSQEELAKKVGTVSVTIGRYERDEIKPSIDIATKIADVLEVSLDYLVGNSDAVLEKSLVKKIADIQKLPEDQKNIVTALLDAFLRDYQAKKNLRALKQKPRSLRVFFEQYNDSIQIFKNIQYNVR